MSRANEYMMPFYETIVPMQDKVLTRSDYKKLEAVVDSMIAAQKQRWEVAARIDEDVQISRLMPSEDRLNWFIARLLVPHMNKLKADLATLDGELGKEQ